MGYNAPFDVFTRNYLTPKMGSFIIMVQAIICILLVLRTTIEGLYVTVSPVRAFIDDTFLKYFINKTLKEKAEENELRPLYLWVRYSFVAFLASILVLFILNRFVLHTDFENKVFQAIIGFFERAKGIVTGN